MSNMPNFKELQRTDQQLADHNVRGEFKDWTVEERQIYVQSKERDFSLALMNVTGDLNTGVLIRTAHLMGVKQVLLFGRNRFDRRSTVGAENYTTVHTFGGLREDLTVDPEVFKGAMDELGLCPVFVETGEFCVTQVDFRNVRQTVERPLCFVLGNEGRGIDDSILATKSHFNGSFNVSIPMVGVMRSYNVANAGAMVMFEYCRQMYGSC